VRPTRLRAAARSRLRAPMAFRPITSWWV